MAERKQPVKCIFRIQVIIGPVTMKTAFGIPKRVNEIQAAFVNLARNPPLETSKCMQGGARGKKIRDRCARNCHESTLRMRLREDPVTHSAIHGETKMSDQRDSSSRRIQGAGFLAGK